MLGLEAKLKGEEGQYRALDEALRTARFIRNSCIRYWMDNIGIGRYELSKYCAVLAAEFDFADKLNSIGLHKPMLKGHGRQFLGFKGNCKKKVEQLTQPFNPFTVSAAPEPEEWMLMGLGAIALLVIAKRRRGTVS